MAVDYSAIIKSSSGGQSELAKLLMTRPVVAGAPYKPKKRSARGFLGNLVDDIQDAATGFFPGLGYALSGVVKDAGRTVGLVDGPYQTDDLLRSIKKSYTDEGTFWHELVGDRDLRSAGKAFYDNPLGPALDVASVFTLGSAGAGRAAGIAAKSAVPGSAARSRLARFSGLDPETLKPETYTVSVDGVGEMTRQVRRDPLARRRQRTFERFSQWNPEMAVIGSGRRVARDKKRRDRTVDMRQEAKVLGPVRRMISGLSRAERQALWVSAGGHKLDDLDKYYGSTLERVNAEILRRVDAGKRGDTFDMDQPDAAGGRGLPRGGSRSQIGVSSAKVPSTALVKYEPPTTGPQSRGLVLDENTGVVRRAGVDEEIRYDEGSYDDVVNAVSRMSNRELNRVKFRLEKRVGELKNIRRSGVLENQSDRFQKAAQAVRGLSAETTQRMIAMGRQSTDGELRRMSLESELMKAAGVVDDSYAGAIRSHTFVRPDKVDTGHNRAVQYSKPGKPDVFKRSTGYAFHYALDETNPEMYLHASRQVFQYQQRVRRFQSLIADSVWMRPDDVAMMERQGWKPIEIGSKLRKDVDLIYATLVDADDIFDGVPGFDEMLRSMEQYLIRPDGPFDGTPMNVKQSGSVDMVPMIPKYAYDELVGEFNQASKFIRMWVDRPTRIWRALTLNLRPAWIVNNFVGQMLLLASAYGVRGLKEYVLQFSLPGRAKRLRVDAEGKPILDELGREQYGEFDAFAELAPELADFGWSREGNFTARDLQGNKVARGMRRWAEFMGRLNQRLTDDDTRRAAFMAELRPHVRKYQKANPGASFEDAARALWEDADFADEVTRRVLDNMIDFTDLSNFERSVIKRVIPFYAWIRGMSKRTGQIALDEPWKLAVGAQLGQYGVQRNEEMYGSLPEFLKGIIGDGSDRVFVTQGLNPFVTPADVTGMLSGSILPGQMTGAQNPLATINPIIKAPIEAAANLDFFYGRPIVDPKYEGESTFLGRLRKQAVGSVPQTRVIKQGLMERDVARGELEYDPLFEPSLKNAMLSYLGLPIRTMDVNQARQRVIDEQKNG